MTVKGSSKIPLDDLDKLARLIFKRGKKYVAVKYGVTTTTVNFFIKKHLSDWSPAGNCKPYDDDYVVYDDGRVWTRKLFRFKKPYRMKNGYMVVNLHDGQMELIGRLVLTVFRRPPTTGEECRHFKDNDPANNNLWNLRWGTKTQNERDKRRHGTSNTGSRHGGAKLTEKHVRILRRRFYAGETDILIRYSRRYGVHKSTVYRAVKRGKDGRLNWAHVK